jgi:hypothetical protein
MSHCKCIEQKSHIRTGLGSNQYHQFDSLVTNRLSHDRFLLLGAFAKLRKATINFVMPVLPSARLSVYPHGTTRLPLEGF